MKRKMRAAKARVPLCHALGGAPSGAVKRTAAGDNLGGRVGSKRAVGAAFEARALDFLRRQRLRFVARNVVCRGGEIDLVMRDCDGALVFVEVRARAAGCFGGALASIGAHKRARLVRAALEFLVRCGDRVSPCRFDVIAFDGVRVVWLRDAFRADDV